jgi:hypothetical protein
MCGLNPSLRSSLEECLNSTMPKARDHAYIVSLQDTTCKEMVLPGNFSRERCLVVSLVSGKWRA